MSVWTVIRVAAGFMSRRRRPFAVAAVLLLVMGPVLFTGSGEAVLLNAAGLAWVGLLLLRLTGSGSGRRTNQRTSTKGGQR